MKQEPFKVTSAMKKLDVCRATIYRMAKRGDLELVKVGRATRVTSESIDRVLNVGMPPSVDEPGKNDLPSERYDKTKRRAATSTLGHKDALEARVTALEGEVTALRKLITKFKEATDECTKTFPAPAGRHRTRR